MSTYYIASLKHTHKGHEHIVWWQRNECGYTPVLGDYCGRYVFGYADDLNDGRSYIAVPVEVVEALASPEPCYRPGARFYDQRGPVVDNTRANWNRLIADSLPRKHAVKVKPEVFRGTRRAMGPDAASTSQEKEGAKGS
jgi:hypothetical protein